MEGTRFRFHRKWGAGRLCRESPKGVDYVRKRDGGLGGLMTLGWLTGDAARRAPHVRSTLIRFFSGSPETVKVSGRSESESDRD